MNDHLKIAILQFDLAWESPESNHKQFQNKIEAIDQPIDLVVLPETFTTGFSMSPEHLAETMDGPTVAWMQSMARKIGTTITGSVIIKEGQQYFNRLLWVGPDGKVNHYDKKHLFGYAGEDQVFAAGTQRKIVTLNGFRICINVCYDLRFPVWSRNKDDYDILLYVANWPAARSHAWSSLLVARAIENMSFVIGANRVGVDGNGHTYSGDSIVIGPDGSTLATADAHQEKTIIHTLLKSDLVTFREKYPFGRDADAFRLL